MSAACVTTQPMPPSLSLCSSAPPPQASCSKSVTQSTPLSSGQQGSGQFAFALISGEVCLIQVSPETPVPSPLSPIDVNIYRHEFIGMFRIAATRALHPSEFRILDILPSAPASGKFSMPDRDVEVRYEEEDGTAFLAKSAIARLQKMMAPASPMQMRRQPNGSPRSYQGYQRQASVRRSGY